MQRRVAGLILALLAGMCTTLGGASVFFIRTLKPLPFTICMAFSAGVMVYVSLVEIFHEGLKYMQLVCKQNPDLKKPNAWAYMFTTLCFFCGYLLASLIDHVLYVLVVPMDRKRREDNKASDGTSRSSDDSLARFTTNPDDEGLELMARAIPLSTTDSSSQVAVELHQRTASLDDSTKAIDPPVVAVGPRSTRREFARLVMHSRANEDDLIEIQHAEERFRRDVSRFVKVGVFTATTLAIHNIPEGMATYSGTVSSPKFGIGMAVAIGIHNIPEGFAVSVPLFFGIGSKWKSFAMSVVSGLAEPVGALIAFAFIGDNQDPLVFAVLFSLIAGIMTNISLQELYPSALKYDPTDKWSSKCLLAGMVVMSISLMLLNFFA